MGWEKIDSAPKDEPLLMGHSPSWEAPLPIYWCAQFQEFRLVDSEIGGNGKKFGIGLREQPTHWDYCSLPPVKEITA